MRRVTGVAASLVALALVAGALALADDDLSELSDQEISDSIVPIDPMIEKMDLGIKKLETKRKEDGKEVLSLSSDILFNIDKHELSDNAKKRIGELVKDVPKGAKISVGGHTDNVPSKVGNKKLSELRAKSVADAIKAARKDVKVDAKGFADSKPVADNGSKEKPNFEGREKNRRVEIRY
ncbi:OmpA family protein [Pseudoglutamicibacter cumminsii]|uniref:OmpA family protein n=1 Tax=Pseudoglutamicibacter cumminsii TaxID=156979 RepID=UPI002ABA6780|nr:OmpA family protein [Pseudoglutamicibacter cumminsii]MDZ3745262.1 OmpA family protein [Pseudoglutamicibacter cumminsii]